MLFLLDTFYLFKKRFQLERYVLLCLIFSFLMLIVVLIFVKPLRELIPVHGKEAGTSILRQIDYFYFKTKNSVCEVIKRLRPPEFEFDLFSKGIY